MPRLLKLVYLDDIANYWDGDVASDNIIYAGGGYGDGPLG